MPMLESAESPCGIARLLSTRRPRGTVSLMTEEEKDRMLERYIELCKRIYERMEREDSWPWKDTADSPSSSNPVESEDNPDNL